MAWGSYPVLIFTRHLSTPAQGANAYRLSWANAMDVSPQGSDPPVSSITYFPRVIQSFQTKRQEHVFVVFGLTGSLTRLVGVKW